MFNKETPMMIKPKEVSDIELVGEIWRKRLEMLWRHVEFSEGKELTQDDIDWIDEQINERKNR